MIPAFQGATGLLDAFKGSVGGLLDKVEVSFLVCLAENPTSFLPLPI